MPSHVVHGDDFFGDLRHVLKVIGPEGAGEPEFLVGGVAGFLAIGVHHDPIGVGVVDILMDGVRIGTGHDVHAEFAAAFDEIAEGILIAQPLTAIVHGDLGGIEGDATARA